jgi:predicted nuclease of restriction endonuclease-like (RecB) superfamily
VNSELTTLYWKIGTRIRKEILQNKRAQYGEEIVMALSLELTSEYGRGFDVKNLRHMIRFAEVFSNHKIVYALRRQLGWTHFRSIIYIDDPLKRNFYAEMCRIERWSTRTLDKKIGGMLYERTALSRKPKKAIEHEITNLRREDQLSPDLIFKDPYFLDFLGLKDRYIEKDIEDSILREMESFLLELGSGFTFVERQKRISVDDVDYYLDLLFYHRGLGRLVALELKLDDFKPAYKGQMELYLRWLKKFEMKLGEKEPIGLILCAGKKDETIELLEMEKSGIRVAQYLTELPLKGVLEKRLHEAIQRARLRLANTKKE